MANTLSIGRMLELSRTKTANEIGRFTFFEDVISVIYNGDIFSALLGVGLGTANTSGDMTQFAKTYYSTHYSWYSMPYMFIATGVLGLIAYVFSFIVIIIHTQKSNRYYQIVVSSVIISIFILFYDEALKTDAGYLLFFLLSLSYVKNASNR